jgi:hypothetical protein
LSYHNFSTPTRIVGWRSRKKVRLFRAGGHSPAPLPPTFQGRLSGPPGVPRRGGHFSETDGLLISLLFSLLERETAAALRGHLAAPVVGAARPCAAPLRAQGSQQECFRLWRLVRSPPGQHDDATWSAPALKPAQKTFGALCRGHACLCPTLPVPASCPGRGPTAWWVDFSARTPVLCAALGGNPCLGAARALDSLVPGARQGTAASSLGAPAPRR